MHLVLPDRLRERNEEEARRADADLDVSSEPVAYVKLRRDICVRQVLRFLDRPDRVHDRRAIRGKRTRARIAQAADQDAAAEPPEERPRRAFTERDRGAGE